MCIPNKLQTEHITIHEKDNCLIIFIQSLKHSLNKYCKTISYKSALHSLHRRKTNPTTRKQPKKIRLFHSSCAAVGLVSLKILSAGGASVCTTSLPALKRKLFHRAERWRVSNTDAAAGHSLLKSKTTPWMSLLWYKSILLMRISCESVNARLRWGRRRRERLYSGCRRRAGLDRRYGRRGWFHCFVLCFIQSR